MTSSYSSPEGRSPTHSAVAPPFIVLTDMDGMRTHMCARDGVDLMLRTLKGEAVGYTAESTRRFDSLRCDLTSHARRIAQLHAVASQLQRSQQGSGAAGSGGAQAGTPTHAKEGVQIRKLSSTAQTNESRLAGAQTTTGKLISQ